MLTPEMEHVDVFSLVPIVGFRRAKSLKDNLVRAKRIMKLVVGNVGQVDVMFVTI